MEQIVIILVFGEGSSLTDCVMCYFYPNLT
nr:MAG TPA: hypothetical protein [Caudoviricetes sp.]